MDLFRTITTLYQVDDSDNDGADGVIDVVVLVRLLFVYKTSLPRLWMKGK